MRCPICGADEAREPDAPPPFCGERCKQVDLGAWLSESYRIPAVEQDDGEDPPSGEGPRET